MGQPYQIQYNLSDQPRFCYQVIIWLFCLALASKFTTMPFNIKTTDSIYFAVTSIIIFDSFLMQLIHLLLGKHASLPMFKQYSEVTHKFNEGYVVYNDVPVLSVVLSSVQMGGRLTGGLNFTG